jgi:flagellar basal-body rod modification protein FlgD
MNIAVNNSHAASAKVASSLATQTVRPKATDGTNGSNSGTDDPSSTITSDDFLTLLVSELKNQGPTQPTDPGAYIQQLVGVNSLQQLIQINQGLSAVESPATTPPTGT